MNVCQATAERRTPWGHDAVPSPGIRALAGGLICHHHRTPAPGSNGHSCLDPRAHLGYLFLTTSQRRVPLANGAICCLIHSTNTNHGEKRQTMT